MENLFPEFNEENWERVRNHPYFQPQVQATLERAKRFSETEPPRVKFSDIHLFATTGERKTFERVYGDYQRRLETFFLAYLLTKDDAYIEPLTDVLWNICDFETWSIPAHVSETLPEERRRRNLDLCSTIMGHRIAEILYFIGDKLPDVVRRRATAEVRTRIIDAYRTDTDYSWMSAKNNWSAVCTASVFAAYLYLAYKEETDAVLPRMLTSIRCYLDGIGDDGCCLEGYGYWDYGFSHFVLFADLLKAYTDGKIDLYRDEKVHQIAKFQQNACINETQAISFSDSGRRFYPSAWLSHHLKHIYPDIEIPPMHPQRAGGSALRCFLWQDPDLADCRMHPTSHIYRDAEWFIHRADAYQFAIKAGHNNEPHNHNDVGSFILSKNGEVTFCDPGSAEYTRQYFSPEERYESLACSSRGHSVPILNGQYQVPGSQKAVILTEATDAYAFTLEQAYAIPTLTGAQRHILCRPDAVTLTDVFSFSEIPQSVVERFVSYQKPEITENGIAVGASVLRFDTSLFDVSLSEETMVFSYGCAPLYLLDLALKKPEKNNTVTLTFS